MFTRVRFFLVVFTLALAISALTVGSAFAAKGKVSADPEGDKARAAAQPASGPAD